MIHATRDIQPPEADLQPQLAAGHAHRLGGAVAQLAWLVAALGLAASVVGLVVDGIYTGPVSTAEMLRGYDCCAATTWSPPGSSCPA